MATKKLNEGVGKKIVEALKMQSKVFEDVGMNQDDSIGVSASQGSPLSQSNPSANTSYMSNNPSIYGDQILPPQNLGYGFQAGMNAFSQVPQSFVDSSLQQSILQNLGMNNPGIESDMEEFNCPPNVAVLRQLIAKLPAGVTRQTGALIIKQTMEALGIPMQSVIQDAQQFRETLNNTAKECQANIVEYRKQIGVLEAKSQQCQRQSAIMNDIISLFVRTNIR